jgi:hypothetical protein
MKMNNIREMLHNKINNQIRIIKKNRFGKHQNI